MPPDLAALREVIRKRAYLLTSHASHRAVERNISSRDIEEAILTGTVIEDYPEDKYGPSCLMLGETNSGRSLHVQVSYPPAVKIVTVYEPSRSDWEADFRTRKSK
jgi:hypothetical protein